MERPIDANELHKIISEWPESVMYKDWVKSAIANAPTIIPLQNDPLTLGQLLEMDGEPVWDTRWNIWGLLDIGLCRVFTRNGDIDLNIALIEQRLYRYKPSE